jgi:23S rRNA (guanosine2251-2'-O)-methyltransferase
MNMSNRTPKPPAYRPANSRQAASAPGENKPAWSPSNDGQTGKDRKYNAAPTKDTAKDNELWAEESSLKGEEEYLAGKHPVLEAMKAGRSINKIFMSNQAQRNLVQPIIDEAKARGIVVHQGVVAQAAAVAYAEVEDMLARAAARGEAPLIVLLDELEDPHNLGSILRSADCTGVHGVIIPKRRSAGLTAVVAKTSAGAVEYVPVARVANLVQTMEKLKAAGLWIAGADAGAKEGFYETNLIGPLAIVIGNEGQGLSRLVRERCDFILSLPMAGQINSLNASVATGVILYEVVRQRQQAQKKSGVPQASPVSGHAGDANVPT